MAYADYKFYVNDFHGNSVSEADFDRLCERAGEYIDYFTLGNARVYHDTDKILAKCCCVVAEVILNEENGGIIASESVGSHSISYVRGTTTGAANAVKSEEQRVYDTVKRYLLNTGLLYYGKG